MTERLTSPQLLAPLAAAGMALFVGLLAGADPRLAIAAVLGGGFIILVLRDVTAGFCVMALLASLDALPVLGAGFSLAKLAGVLLGASWIAYVATHRAPSLAADRSLYAFVVGTFLVWTAMSVAWAEERDAVLEALGRYAPNLLLIPIAYTAVRTTGHVRSVLLAIVAACLISAVLGVIGPASDPSSLSDGRAQGLAGGANELAASLVVGTVLCAAFAGTRSIAPVLRWALAGGAALCLLGIFLSLSRGGLVALAGALLAAVLVAGPWRRRALVMALLVVGGTVTYFAVFASLPDRERVTQVGSGTGRSDLWTVGGRMVAEQPLLGVGAGNFPYASIDYLLEPGAIDKDDFIITTPKVAHNTVLEVLAETGIPGAVLFLTIVGGALWWMLDAARRFGRAGERDMALLCRGLLVATAGYLTAAMFISANYSKLLWLLIALGPALAAVARRTR